MHDLTIENARLYPMTGVLRQSEHTAISLANGKISALGVNAKQLGPSRQVLDLGGQILLPGLIDCHTHALYAGHRMDEHKLKLQGATYEELAAAGGGIWNTVQRVRAADPSDLIAQTLPRIQALAREGVTTIEIKSGYGLDTETELKMLRAIGALDKRIPNNLVPTLLGAHAVPKGKSKADYLDEIVTDMLPRVAKEKLSSTVDIFVEAMAFNVDDMCHLFRHAKELGLSIRAHAEQLSNSHAAKVAADMGALSLDHVEYLDQEGIAAMKRNGTVAVLLPGAFYFLRETTKPPVAELRKAGVPMALATDLNPGSSPVTSLLTCMHMACILFGLTAEEALLGVTKHGAEALGLQDSCGTLEEGKRADLTAWDIPEPEFLVYQLGGLVPTEVLINGESVN